MNQKNILKGISLVLGFVALQACSSDFTDVGSDLIGGGNFDIESYTVKDIKAYNQAYGAVDASRLGEVPMGYLRNGVFGSTSSDLVVQFTDVTTAFGELGDNVKVDSVYVYVPYFSQFDKVEEKVNLYKLKNVYGDGSMDLEVYQNNYHLMDVDLTTGEASTYFTDETSALFDANLGSAKLNTSSQATQNTNFIFNDKEISIYKRNKDGDLIKDPETGEYEVKESLIPGMWLDLDKDYFTRFITDNKSKLNDASQINELFKGLYFKASSNGSKGAVGLLDVAKGKMVIVLHSDKKTTDADGKETVKSERRELSMNFGANTVGTKKFTVNAFRTTDDATYQSEIANADVVNGDELIYLRGGAGSVAVIDVLKSNDLEELKALKAEEVMLNEAFLTIYVAKDEMLREPMPERLFLYDYDNNIGISDFVNDAVSDGQYIKKGYNGIFVKEDTENNKEGYYYRFKITEHMRSILKNKHDVSPKLALAVANNFAIGGYIDRMLKSEIVNTPNDVKTAPSYTVSTPIGVVLHGANSADVSKRMKLEMYYTKARK